MNPNTWTRSTRCSTGGCVDVLHAPDWRTSTRSGGTGCVSVARPDGAVLVRDSKDPDSPMLTFDPAAWRDFIDAIKAEQ